MYVFKVKLQTSKLKTSKIHLKLSMLNRWPSKLFIDLLNMAFKIFNEKIPKIDRNPSSQRQFYGLQRSWGTGNLYYGNVNWRNPNVSPIASVCLNCGHLCVACPSLIHQRWSIFLTSSSTENF